MADSHRIAKHRPIGPFAPPLPKDAEDPQGAEPMAVANDKATIHGESFLSTSSPRDSWDEGVALKFGKRVDKARSDDETRSMQSPPRYTKPDENGWAELKDDEE